MESILAIEMITLFGILIIASLFWVAGDIAAAIKKHKKEKAKNFDPLDKF